jgi:hypothetical protein
MVEGETRDRKCRRRAARLNLQIARDLCGTFKWQKCILGKPSSGCGTNTFSYAIAACAIARPSRARKQHYTREMENWKRYLDMQRRDLAELFSPAEIPSRTDCATNISSTSLPSRPISPRLRHSFPFSASEYNAASQRGRDTQ